MPNIYWKPQEITDLAELLISRRVDHHAWGFVSVVRDLQHVVISKDRIRPIKNRKSIQSLVDEIERIKKLPKEVSLQKVLDIPVKEELKEIESPEVSDFKHSPYSLPTGGEKIKDLSYDDLFQMFASKVANQLLTAMGDQIQQFVQTQILKSSENSSFGGRNLTNFDLSPTPTAKAAREHLPKVVIVGLIRQQMNDVEDEFRNTLQFTFIKSQDASGHNHNMFSRKADLVVAMTKFISHEVSNAAKKLDAPYVLMNGGVSGLKKWLHKWLDGDIEPSKVVHDFKDIKNL